MNNQFWFPMDITHLASSIRFWSGTELVLVLLIDLFRVEGQLNYVCTGRGPDSIHGSLLYVQPFRPDGLPSQTLTDLEVSGVRITALLLCACKLFIIVCGSWSLVTSKLKKAVHSSWAAETAEIVLTGKCSSASRCSSKLCKDVSGRLSRLNLKAIKWHNFWTIKRGNHTYFHLL